MKHLRLKILTISTFMSVVGSAAAKEGVPLLAPNPTKISLLLHMPRNDFAGQFGHMDLRISYDEKYSDEDRVVGFGPEELEDPAAIGSGPYLGIGAKRLNLTQWNVKFAETLQSARFEAVADLESLELPLSPKERNKVVDVLNNALANGYPKPYQLFKNNCVSTLAEIISENSNLPKGLLNFLPTGYAKTLRGRALQSVKYKGGRSLREIQYDKDLKVLKTKFSADELGEIYALIMHHEMDFRIVGLSRLSKKIDISEYLKLESQRRQEAIQKTLASYEALSTFSPKLRASQKITNVKIESGRLVYEVTSSDPFAMASKGKTAPTRSSREAILPVEWRNKKLKTLVVDQDRVLIVEDFKFEGPNG